MHSAGHSPARPDTVRSVLTELTIESFKAYESQTISLQPLAVIVGRNGAGKTSVLQAVEFLGALVAGTLPQHLEARGWDYKDLPHLRSDHKQFGFTATVALGRETYDWELRLGARRRSGIARERVVRRSDGTVLMVRTGRNMARLDDVTGEQERVAQTLTSSWLATVTSDDRPRFPDLLRLANWARGIGGYLALNPAVLREPSRKADDLGPGGERLAGLLRRIRDRKDGSFERLVKRVQKRYPQLRELSVRQGSYGWNRLEVTEKWGKEVVTLNARQVSDGLLRLIAVTALQEAPNRPTLVMIDEVENGVHPHLLGGLMALLTELADAGTQVIATSHSPIALNHVASAEQVVLARRTPRGPATLTPVSSTRGYRELGDHFDVGELWFNLGEQRLLRPRS